MPLTINTSQFRFKSQLSDMVDSEASASTSSTRDPRAGNLLTDSIAALLSSSLFAAVFYPLHRVKILLQTQDGNPLVTSGQVKRYRVLTAVPRLVREGGVRDLWRGNGPYMLRHVPSTTLSFAFKDALLRVMPHYSAAEDLGRATLVNLAAGFLGGAAALFLVYPLDFATIRMAAELRQSQRAQGVMATLNSAQRHGGLAALYRGFGVSATAIGAYKALYFGLYDTACAVLEQRGRHPQHQHQHHHHHRQHISSILQRWAAANLVVLTASTVTYPLDVVRKRLVADTALGPKQHQYKGFFDCVIKIARTEGLGGFYRFYGYDMLLRLGGGVLLVMYDEMKAHGPGSIVRQVLSLLPQQAGQAQGHRAQQVQEPADEEQQGRRQRR